MSQYQEFLAGKHRRFITPPDRLVDAAVARATGAPVSTKRRIVKGESNVVYDVRTVTSQAVIVRVSRKPHALARAQKEQWVLDHCRRRDLPVPQILLVEPADVDGGLVSIVVATKLPGLPLDEWTATLAPSAPQMSSLLAQVGRVLSIIHSVPTTGLGELDANGRGRYATFGRMGDRDDLAEEPLRDAAARAGCDPCHVARAFALVRAARTRYPPIAPRLIHNDIGPKHILVQGSRITGVIDFESAEGGDPARDLAHWAFYYDDRWPAARLIDGYRVASVFTQDFAWRVALWKVITGLTGLRYFLQDENATCLAHVRARLARDVADCEAL